MKSFSDVLKGMTVTSVHTPTALGNEKPRRAASFLSVMEGIKKKRGAHTISLEITDGDIVHGLVSFFQRVSYLSRIGHSFTLEADRKEGGGSDYPRTGIDGDGGDYISRVLLDGEDVTKEKANSDSNRVSKSLNFDFSKADTEHRLIFGWASISTMRGQPVVDKQGDIIPTDELETAAYDFVLNSRQQGDLHEITGVGRLVESCVFSAEKQAALGIDLGKEGWWVGFYVENDDVWGAIKRGERPEFSIGGSGHRVPVGTE